MCGIAGWINLEKSNSKNHERDVLHSMCERIVHRGPDSEGIWMDDSVALGMRRLSIIDLKTGDQPVFSEDKSVIAMINGELYNFREVKAEFEKLGHKFVTQTDVEIVPHLYRENRLVVAIGTLSPVSSSAARKRLRTASRSAGAEPNGTRSSS